MGKVYKARDTAIGRDVAIKVLPAELAQQTGYRERFRREALTAARLTEPHIIPIYDTGEIDGHLYLSMPVVDGTDLASVIGRDGAMTPEMAVKVIEQLASALDAAHANGLVHRDVKPSNALMTGNTFVYLIDFGIAHSAEATRLTQTGMVVGTIAYMAPERFVEGKADARGDVYALACVLHECLTGRLPYPGSSVEQMMAAHLSLDAPVPTTVNPAIPAGFDAVIARGMAKDPEQRYQTAAQLAVAARRALADAPGAAETVTTGPRSAPTEVGVTPAPVGVTPAPPTAAVSKNVPTLVETDPARPNSRGSPSPNSAGANPRGPNPRRRPRLRDG